MTAPFCSRPHLVATAFATAAVLIACSSSSPGGGGGGDAAKSQDAASHVAEAGPNPGHDASSMLADGPMVHLNPDGGIGDAPGGPDETEPDEGIVDAGTPETLEGEGGLMVTWTEGCWYETGGMKYQAMSFTVESSTPLPLEGTLFYNATCDPSDGTDNLNDTGGTTPSGSWIFWFIHHPGLTNSSAIWSYGGIKSACINYNVAPDC
jgi:hypothetical protein